MAKIETPVKKTSDVFTPGKGASTYVERSDTEKELGRPIRRGGWLVFLVGATKMGKSVLANRAAPNAFVLEGAMIKSTADFWEKFAAYLGIPTEKGRSTVTGDRSKWGFFANLPFFGGEAGGEHHVDREVSSTSAIHADFAVKEAVKTIVSKDGRVTVVIDDFHFIPSSVRSDLLQGLKPVISAGATVILITLPHSRDDTDASQMGGRNVTIPVRQWDESDLARIAAQGLPKLNLTDSCGLGDELAKASYGSPQIMQHLCLELVEEINGVHKTCDRPTDLVAPSDKAAFFRIVEDDGATNWVKRFMAGPAVRGTGRKQHTMVDGRTFDGYYVIIAALKELGPPLALSTTQLNTQIDKMLKFSRAADVRVEAKLVQMSALAARPLWAKLKEAQDEDATGDAELFESGVVDPAAGLPQPVFEFTPGAVGPTIHILEPYVAYTIRWHVQELAVPGADARWKPHSRDTPAPPRPRRSQTSG